MQFLVFDVWTDLAQFKKPFTTMSPQTFGIPTGTAAIGMIAAILGLDKDRYWSYFYPDHYLLSMGVKNPVKKVVIPMNTIKADDKKYFSRFKQHKQMNMEFLKDARFRFYFAWDNNALWSELKERLENHECVYTISLGLAWNLANFKYYGVYEGNKEQKQTMLPIHSVIDQNQAIEVNFGLQKIFSARIPVAMEPIEHSRKVNRFGDYLFDSEGKTINARVKTTYALNNGENIVPI